MAQKTVLVIGGSGAQGTPIVRALSNDPQYAVRVMTRSPNGDSAQELLALPNASVVEGDSANEDDLRKAFKEVDMAFVNLNSFALGIRAEIYWGMRIFEIAVQSGVQHYVWSALEDAMLLSGYDETCRVAHYEGKSRVTQWMRSRPQTPMKWSVLTTGPYIEMLSELMRPMKEEDGTFVYELPLKDGAIPFVALEDVGKAVHWLLDSPSESAGLNLKLSVEHASGDTVASAFTAVTGLPARYKSIPVEQWTPPGPPEHRMGSTYEGNKPEDLTNMTIGRSFRQWWNLYQRSGGNKGLLKTEYQLLDRILPDRIKSVEDWMRKVGYTGERKSVLKNYKGK